MIVITAAINGNIQQNNQLHIWYVISKNSFDALNKKNKDKNVTLFLTDNIDIFLKFNVQLEFLTQYKNWFNKNDENDVQHLFATEEISFFIQQNKEKTNKGNEESKEIFYVTKKNPFGKREIRYFSITQTNPSAFGKNTLIQTCSVGTNTLIQTSSVGTNTDIEPLKIFNKSDLQAADPSLHSHYKQNLFPDIQTEKDKFEQEKANFIHQRFCYYVIKYSRLNTGIQQEQLDSVKNFFMKNIDELFMSKEKVNKKSFQLLLENFLSKDQNKESNFPNLTDQKEEGSFLNFHYDLYEKFFNKKNQLEFHEYLKILFKIYHTSMLKKGKLKDINEKHNILKFLNKYNLIKMIEFDFPNSFLCKSDEEITKEVIEKLQELTSKVNLKEDQQTENNNQEEGYLLDQKQFQNLEEGLNEKELNEEGLYEKELPEEGYLLDQQQFQNLEKELPEEGYLLDQKQFQNLEEGLNKEELNEEGLYEKELPEDELDGEAEIKKAFAISFIKDFNMKRMKCFIAKNVLKTFFIKNIYLFLTNTKEKIQLAKFSNILNNFLQTIDEKNKNFLIKQYLNKKNNKVLENTYKCYLNIFLQLNTLQLGKKTFKKYCKYLGLAYLELIELEQEKDSLLQYQAVFKFVIKHSLVHKIRELFKQDRFKLAKHKKVVKMIATSMVSQNIERFNSQKEESKTILPKKTKNTVLNKRKPTIPNLEEEFFVNTNTFKINQHRSPKTDRRSRGPKVSYKEFFDKITTTLYDTKFEEKTPTRFSTRERKTPLGFFKEEPFDEKKHADNHHKKKVKTK